MHLNSRSTLSASDKRRVRRASVERSARIESLRKCSQTGACHCSTCMATAVAALDAAVPLSSNSLSLERFCPTPSFPIRKDVKTPLSEEQAVADDTPTVEAKCFDSSNAKEKPRAPVCAKELFPKISAASIIDVLENMRDVVAVLPPLVGVTAEEIAVKFLAPRYGWSAETASVIGEGFRDLRQYELVSRDFARSKNHGLTRAQLEQLDLLVEPHRATISISESSASVQSCDLSLSAEEICRQTVAKRNRTCLETDDCDDALFGIFPIKRRCLERQVVENALDLSFLNDCGPGFHSLVDDLPLSACYPRSPGSPTTSDHCNFSQFGASPYTRLESELAEIKAKSQRIETCINMM